MKTILETERLILRPWEESDAEELYKYASHPDVGPMAGWAVHTSVENSREVIRDVLSAPGTYAVVLRETGLPVGSVGLMHGKASHIGLPDGEGEIGYWIGVPYWGQGLIPEAVRELMRYGFEQLALDRIWCGYYDGNLKSKRVQEKCGFRCHHTSENVPCAIPGLLRTEHMSCITRDQWLWDRLYAAAKAVQNGRKISDYVEAGGVAAAILSGSGRIYTGVCVDTCSTLGVCAERNAIFSMITNGEQEIKKVLAIMPGGKTGAPCGACRELMVQLMPTGYKGIEIMLDRESEKIATLGELTPGWWI